MPESVHDDALAVVRQLRDAGHVAYFAGGCVRDTLLGRAPKDYDVATDAPPPRVRTLFSNTQAVGAAFGVILVRHGRSVIEVATFRTDGRYTDGRRPDAVRFSTAEDDARRRDFTINGLFLDPLESDRVIDYVGGRADLEARQIRAIGDPAERFAEDHLRLLRAVRFASRLEFRIEPATAAAISAHAGELPRISPERIADELRRMLTGPTRRAGYEQLHLLGLLDVLLRHLPNRVNAGRPIFAAVDGSADEDTIGFGLALAAVTLQAQVADDADLPARLADVGRTVTALRKTFRLSNDESDAAAAALAFGPLLPGMSVAACKRFLAKPNSEGARRLMKAVAAAGVMPAVLKDRLAMLEALSQTDYAPPPLVTGDDLTAGGFAPGPAFKRALDLAYDAQLEGRVSEKAAALGIARALLST